MTRSTTRSGSLAGMLRNALWLSAGRGVGAVLSIVYLGIVTRSLGPAGFGRFVLVLGIGQTIAAAVNVQTWQAIVRFGTPYLRSGRQHALARLATFGMAIDFAMAFAGCVLAVILVIGLRRWLGWDDAAAWRAMLFAGALLLSTRSTAIGLLRVHDRYAVGAVADSVTPALRMAGAIAVMLIGPTVERFLIVWALSELLTAALYWLLAARMPGPKLALPRLRTLRLVIRQNPALLHFIGASNAGTLLSTSVRQMTVIVVGIWAGPIAAGHYRLANQLAQALARIADLISRALFGELARVQAKSDSADLIRLFRQSLRLALILAVTIALLVLLIGRPALGLIAGDAYLPAYPLLLLLALAAAIDVAGVGFEPALLAKGLAGRALLLRLAGVGVLLVALAVLLPLKGAWGAAMAILIASAVTLILFGRYSWRIVHMR